MKLLLFYANSFNYTPFKKVLEEAEDLVHPGQWTKAVVVFYQFEAEDLKKGPGLLRKIVKNIKWLAGKFRTKTVILHSFSHLSTSKAPPDFGLKKMAEVKQRLVSAGFFVGETPYGYLNQWSIDVAGESLAKVFKEL